MDSNPDLDSNQLDLDSDSRKKGVDLDLDSIKNSGLGLGFEVPGFAHHWLGLPSPPSLS